MGGNVFDNTGQIYKHHINPTLKKYISTLQSIFPKIKWDFTLLGSAGKKEYSGDLDLTIAPELLDVNKLGLDLCKLNTRLNLLIKRARTSSLKQLKLKAILLEMADRINTSDIGIVVAQKRTTTSMMFSSFPQYDESGVMLSKLVQIDWMVGNPEWLTFSYFSDVYPVHGVKGLHRTQLLVALFRLINYHFVHESGIKDSGNNIIANTPNSALNVVNSTLNLNLTVDIAKNYFTLYDYLYANLPHSTLIQLVYLYFQIMWQSNNIPPPNLQNLFSSSTKS